ncbi:MAG: septum formation protein Maf [Deltaproteobacteria bacterium]|nr:MAG: septum formation protein Maf [Deltaproteobacteria bacterium]
MTLILSSKSPRRKELLERLGIRLIIAKPDVPEERREGESPYEHVRRLAREKALYGANLHPGYWSLGADTIVLLGDEILGKPRDREDAKRMLQLLSGKVHKVITVFSLVNLRDSREFQGMEETLVKFLPLEDREIEWYIRTGEPLDKAGAYAIQGIGGGFIEWIRGSYTNVVGLPIAQLLGPLKEVGLWVP